MTEMRDRAARGLAPGDRFEVTRRFTQAEVDAFAALTRDYNPIHLEPRYAALHGFDATVCHGLLVGGLLTEVGGQIAWLASGMSFRFRAPVYPGDTIRCVLRVTEIDEDGKAQGTARMTNQRGEVVLEADLYGRVPREREQRVLRQMLDEGDPTNGL